MEEIKTNQNSQLGDRSLPNATAVLVLGILSIPGCCCPYGILGLILGIVALVLASKDLKEYRKEPELFSVKSFKNLNAGRICALIGLALSAVSLILGILGLIYGDMWNIPQDPSEWEEYIKQMQD